MALLVERLNRKSDRPDCSVGCKVERSGQVLGRRKATYRAVIIGRDVPLCDRCVKAWEQTWERALGGWSA